MGDNDSPDTDQQDDPKDLRAKLEKVIADNKKLTEALDQKNRAEAINKAKLDHLNEVQLTALNAVLGDKEYTPENLTEIAKSLNFHKEEEPPSTNGETPLPEEKDPDTSVIDRINAANKATNVPDTGAVASEEDFRKQMVKAAEEGPEALAAVIDKFGGKYNMLTDKDIE